MPENVSGADIGDGARQGGRMSKLQFSDGMEFDTSGELRLELRRDGWYAVGRGMLMAVRDEAEGEALIARMNARRKLCGPADDEPDA